MTIAERARDVRHTIAEIVLKYGGTFTGPMDSEIDALLRDAFDPGALALLGTVVRNLGGQIEVDTDDIHTGPVEIECDGFTYTIRATVGES